MDLESLKELMVRETIYTFFGLDQGINLLADDIVPKWLPRDGRKLNHV